MNENLMALSGNWMGQGSLTTADYTTGNYGQTTFYQPYPWTYPVYVSSDTRPIKLTMSEVLRLRKAAQGDEKLKAVLAKFTNHIEVMIDFD